MINVYISAVEIFFFFGGREGGRVRFPKSDVIKKVGQAKSDQIGLR